MDRPINALLQTTMEHAANDWHVGRFSMSSEYLASLQASGGALFRVTASDRDKVGAPDPVLSSLDRSTYEELWLFAVDTGDGLHADDLAGILRFRARGGGLLVTRDHMDLGRAGSVTRPFVSYALDQPGAYEVAGVELSEVEAGEEAKAAGVLRLHGFAEADLDNHSKTTEVQAHD